ncbi:MAG TPA: PEP-CTERM sorting domain-containing protein [Phycisphaerae bacterium]|nr:PEP-CTERM sorting domain-containing protein [Phycisphaerae bacterium]
MRWSRSAGVGIALVLTWSAAGPVGAAVRIWTGAQSNVFNNSGNWSPVGSLQASDLLTVPGGQPYQVGAWSVSNGGMLTFDSIWTVGTFTGSVYAADAGIGRVNVLNGAALGAANVYVGDNAGSQGTLKVAGAGSLLQVSSSVTVGNAGEGTLAVIDGATLNCGAATLAIGGASSAVAIVSGAGSTWSNSGNITVGHGSTAALTLADGAVMDSVDAVLGYSGGGDGTVTVSGPGSRWAGRDFTIGRDGTGRLEVVGGAAIAGRDASVGTGGSSQGEVYVSGAGSAWECSGQLWVGESGRGEMVIRDGGRVANVEAMLGGSGAASSAEALVDGAGSTWDSGDQLTVGFGGPGTLTVSNGGLVASQSGRIGSVAGGAGQVEISGEGSRWTVVNSLEVGHDAEGALSVLSGAEAWCDALVVGSEITGSGEVTVGGEGSVLTCGDLAVGRYGAGTLTVEQGGAVLVAGTLSLAELSGSQGRLVLLGGSLTAEAIAPSLGTATLDWTGGRLTVTGASGLTLTADAITGPSVILGAGKELAVTGSLTVATGVSLDLTGGVLGVGGLIVNGTARLTSGSANLGGSLALGAGAVLDLRGQDLALTAAPTLNAGSRLRLADTVLSAPALTVPAGAEVDFDSGLILAGTLTNSEVIRMGTTGPATIRAAALVNGGAILGKGSIQAPVSNTGRIALSGDSSFGGDVVNQSGGRIIVSGGAGVTFFEDLDNQAGAEISVSPGCAATYFGALAGSGDFTGTGTSYIEGDMRPGSSPDIVGFEGTVVFGPAALLAVELAEDIYDPALPHYDSLTVGGDVHADGALELTWLPRPGDAASKFGGDYYVLLYGGELSGEFTVTGPLAAYLAGIDYDVPYAPGIEAVRITLYDVLDGDCDLDGDVDGDDLAAIEVGQLLPEPDWFDGDVNFDGAVDHLDYLLWKANAGLAVRDAGAPEPATIVLLGLGGAWLARRRRR